MTGRHLGWRCRNSGRGGRQVIPKVFAVFVVSQAMLGFSRRCQIINEMGFSTFPWYERRVLCLSRPQGLRPQGLSIWHIYRCGNDEECRDKARWQDHYGQGSVWWCEQQIIFASRLENCEWYVCLDVENSRTTSEEEVGAGRGIMIKNFEYQQCRLNSKIYHTNLAFYEILNKVLMLSLTNKVSSSRYNKSELMRISN